MKCVFCISSSGFPGQMVRKRVTRFHKAVYHGSGYYLNKPDDPMITDRIWRRPAMNNSNRELLHVRRSGRFVPRISFPTSQDLVITREVKDLLQGLPGIDFLPVVYEKLVDVHIPEIGDLSDDEWREYGPVMETISAMPDVPEFHDRVGEGFVVLMPEYYEIEDSITDSVPYVPKFGRYFAADTNLEEPLSLKLLETHAMYRAAGYVFLTERAFEIIAPFLDLDYIMIDFISLRQRRDPATGLPIESPPLNK
jgi:hypothetical protein